MKWILTICLQTKDQMINLVWAAKSHIILFQLWSSHLGTMEETVKSQLQITQSVHLRVERKVKIQMVNEKSQSKAFQEKYKLIMFLLSSTNLPIFQTQRAHKGTSTTQTLKWWNKLIGKPPNYINRLGIIKMIHWVMQRDLIRKAGKYWATLNVATWLILSRKK
jgi:hypothetical protein